VAVVVKAVSSLGWARRRQLGGHIIPGLSRAILRVVTGAWVGAAERRFGGGFGGRIDLPP